MRVGSRSAVPSRSGNVCHQVSGLEGLEPRLLLSTVQTWPEVSLGGSAHNVELYKDGVIYTREGGSLMYFDGPASPVRPQSPRRT